MYPLSPGGDLFRIAKYGEFQKGNKEWKGLKASKLLRTSQELHQISKKDFLGLKEPVKIMERQIRKDLIEKEVNSIVTF